MKQDKLLDVLQNIVQARVPAKIPKEYYSNMHKLYNLVEELIPDLDDKDKFLNALNEFEEYVLSLLNKEIKADTQQVLAGDSVRYLITVLYRKLGNKRYLHDLERLLEEKLDNLDAKDDRTILYLAHGLRDL